MTGFENFVSGTAFAAGVLPPEPTVTPLAVTVTNSPGELWLLVLGAVLALAGGMIAFFVQSWWTQRRSRAIVYEFLRDILRAFDRTAQRIIETYDRTNVVWNDLLQLIGADGAIAERNREQLVLVKNPELRRQLWDWFADVRTMVATAFLANNVLVSGNQTQKEWAASEIPKQLTRLRDLKQRAAELLRQL